MFKYHQLRNTTSSDLLRVRNGSALQHQVGGVQHMHFVFVARGWRIVVRMVTRRSLASETRRLCADKIRYFRSGRLCLTNPHWLSRCFVERGMKQRHLPNRHCSKKLQLTKTYGSSTTEQQGPAKRYAREQPVPRKICTSKSLPLYPAQRNGRNILAVEKRSIIYKNIYVLECTVQGLFLYIMWRSVPNSQIKWVAAEQITAGPPKERVPRNPRFVLNCEQPTMSAKDLKILGHLLFT